MHPSIFLDGLTRYDLYNNKEAPACFSSFQRRRFDGKGLGVNLIAYSDTTEIWAVRSQLGRSFAFSLGESSHENKPYSATYSGRRDAAPKNYEFSIIFLGFEKFAFDSSWEELREHINRWQLRIDEDCDVFIDGLTRYDSIYQTDPPASFSAFQHQRFSEIKRLCMAERIEVFLIGYSETTELWALAPDYGHSVAFSIGESGHKDLCYSWNGTPPYYISLPPLEKLAVDISAEEVAKHCVRYQRKIDEAVSRRWTIPYMDEHTCGTDIALRCRSATYPKMEEWKSALKSFSAAIEIVAPIELDDVSLDEGATLKFKFRDKIVDVGFDGEITDEVDEINEIEKFHYVEFSCYQRNSADGSLDEWVCALYAAASFAKATDARCEDGVRNFEEFLARAKLIESRGKAVLGHYFPIEDWDSEVWTNKGTYRRWAIFSR